MKTYIGVDLGLNGAICIQRGQDIEVIRMPVLGGRVHYPSLYLLLSGLKPEIVVFEKIAQIFGSSKKTAFVMGTQLGSMEMLCTCLEFNYKAVPPKEWQKWAFDGMTKINKPGKTSTDTKKMALTRIKQLYPKLKLTFGERATKPHDGLIDSILIMNYGKILI